MASEESFKAWGHPNIRSTHETTLMLTRDRHLTNRGDCIVAVSAEKGLKDLAPDLKSAISNDDSRVVLTLVVEGSRLEIEGRGSSELTLLHRDDMVVRKSGFICDRTLMIGADKAACDIPQEIISLLQDGDQEVKVTISAESVTQR